jgi:hypothetical protein
MNINAKRAHLVDSQEKSQMGFAKIVHAVRIKKNREELAVLVVCLITAL